MLFYTLRVAEHSVAESFYQRAFGLIFMNQQAGCNIYVSANHQLMVAVVKCDAIERPEGRCRGHVLFPLATDAEVDEIFVRVVNAGGRALMAPRRTSLGHYSGYINGNDGYLWELTSNIQLLDSK